MLYAKASTQSIAIVILVVLTGAWLVYLLWNVRKAARPEIGSEIELAPNRKEYLDDEQLEGRRLEKFQLIGLGMLAISAVGLPLYWLHEPARQAGAVEDFDETFARWGSRDFATTADGGFNCAGCHGGMKAQGGVAAYTITDPRTGEVQAVNWTAPALNTVLYRFSVDEVTYILTYGRPFSPMSAWGIAGGGPMNDQQISDIIAYIQSIQIPMEGCDSSAGPICEGGNLPKGDAANPAVNTQAAIQAAAEATVQSGQYKTLGEALFNLDLNGGAYSCARCHTKGWSYGDPQQSGGGAMGPNLTNGDTVRQFPNQEDHVTFVETGSEDGKKYGQQGQGTGRMPAFGQMLTARADRGHRRVRAEPLMSGAMTLAVTWSPFLRGIIVVAIAVAVLVRQHLPAAAHQPWRPPRFPRGDGRPLRLDGADGRRVGDLRDRAQGRRPDVEAGRGHQPTRGPRHQPHHRRRRVPAVDRGAGGQQLAPAGRRRPRAGPGGGGVGRHPA